MMQNTKRIIGNGHLELKFKDVEESGVLNDPCIFKHDCCLRKDYCTVEVAVSCRTYSFLKKYGMNYKEEK